jgi:hypothetical protein
VASPDFLTTALGIDKPTEAELRDDATLGGEAEPPIPATPEPASSPSTEPAAAEPVAEEAPAAAEPDYAALYTAEVQARERERAGLLRQMQELRARGIEAQPPTVQPEQPAQPLTVPIKFNEQGQAYIEQPVPPPPQPMNPMAVAAARGEQLRQNIILEDPVANARPMNRVYNAFISLDQMVGARFAQVPTPVRSIDDVLAYIQTQGLDREIAQQFPDVVRTYDDLELLLEAGLELSERKVRRIVRSTAARMKEYDAAAAKGNGAQPAAATPATSAPPKAIGDKPRSQAKRGEGEGGVPPDRLAELDAKDPWRWTKAEAEEYARLAKNEVPA